MKKIFSILLTVAIVITCLGSVAFAEYTGVATDKTLSFGGYSSITIPKDEVDAEFTVTINISDIPADTYYDGVSFRVKPTGVEVVNSSYTAAATLGFESATISTDKMTIDFTAGTSWGLSAKELANANNVLATLTLKRVDNSKTATLEFDSATYVTDSIGGGSIGASDMQTLTINFEEEQQQVTYPTLDEETFDAAATVDGVTVKNGSKAWTVFQKTARDLAAESYGVQVVTGGKTYKFPGKVAITLGEAKEKVWGIKLIAPDNAFEDGTTFAPTSIKAYDPTGEYDELVK